MSKRVMIVDDSLIVREMVSLTLGEAGFEVVAAGNGQDGLKKAEGQRLDLVITDLNTPVMDGISLIRALRGLPGTKHTPILMLTTESQVEKKMEGKAAGATGWITKPFAPPKLLTVISKVLV
ncbi:MAG TPA: response regulator [Armatimonadota bacterium]|jgi:two-component system chemotaxis response regulator CheY